MGKWLYQQATILYDPDTGTPVGFFGGDGKEYMCQFGNAVPISLGGTVDEHSLLPAAASHALENWLVTSTTGIWPFRKSAGLWRSNGTSWSLMMDYDELVNQINVNTANIATKQDELVSTVNIKSINGASIIGSGDLVVSGGGGISDGDKGDITVSGSGTVWTIDTNVVTFSKVQDISTSTFLGRVTAGSGDTEVLSVAQAKTLLNYTAADVGASATGHSHLLVSITDVSMSVADLNSLDDGANSTLHFHDSDRSRANHTGTQTTSTISDFPEAVDDRVAALVVAGTNMTITYNDGTNTLTFDAATSGGGGGGSPILSWMI